MERIAFIFGNHIIYWSQLALMIAAAAALCAFAAVHLLAGGKPFGTMLALPLTLGLGLVLGRLVHWCLDPSFYTGLSAAFSNFSNGSYALTGAFAGVLAALVLLRLIKALDDLPKALDCAAIAGALGIGIGRLSSLFNSPEVQFDTFTAQAAVAGVLFVGLTALYLLGKRLRSGDTCLLFCLLYGLSQVLLDSTLMQSSGFSTVQLLSIGLILVPIVLFSLRLVRARGWNGWYMGFFGGIATLLVGVMIMEYFVQQQSAQAQTFHGIMGLLLAGILALTLVIYCLTNNNNTPD